MNTKNKATALGILSSLAVTVLFSSSVSAATTPTCTTGPTWAYNVVSFKQGPQKDGGAIPALASDPSKALGPAENTSAAGTYVSLGKGGQLVLQFQYPVTNGAGVDLGVYESTQQRGGTGEEKAKVEVSYDGINYFNVGTASSNSNDNYIPGRKNFDIASTGLAAFQFVRITDTTNFGLDPWPTFNGFDVDAVRVLYGTCTPAATLTLKKATDPAGQAGSFTINIGGAASYSTTLSDGQSQTYYVFPGSYTVTETVPSGWFQPTINCNGTSILNGGTIGVAESQQVTCTLTSTACTKGKRWGYMPVTFNQGRQKDGNAIPATLSDPYKSLGQSELTSADGTFVALGKQGSIVIKFPTAIANGDGIDFAIDEASQQRGGYPEETASVEVSNDGKTYYSVGKASSLNIDSYVPGRTNFDIASTGLTKFQYVRITDSTDFSKNTSSIANGFDVDGVRGIYGICE